MTAGPTLIDATDTRNRPQETAAPIRVAVLDNHAAVPAGPRSPSAPPRSCSATPRPR